MSANASERSLTIGEVGTRTGLRPSSIRYYESIGLLPKPYRVSRQRRYDEGVLHTLAVIESGKRAGLSLEEIRQLLRASDRGTVGPTVQALAERKLPEVEGLIARAEAVRRWLQAARACQCPQLDDCPLFGPF
jgi:MerR family redox-sensitive transcriptional activator SoxR